MKKHFLIPLNESKLPLFAETIGYNPAQESITRPKGYPYYHWIQTVSGLGSIKFQNQKINLPPITVSSSSRTWPIRIRMNKVIPLHGKHSM